MHSRNNSCEVFEIILKERMNRLNKNSTFDIALKNAYDPQTNTIQFILLGIGRDTFENLFVLDDRNTPC